MTWMEFIVSVVQYTAWPLAVFAVALVLRQQVQELISRIEVLRHKDTEFRFGEAVEKVEAAAEDDGPQYEEAEEFAAEVSRLKRVAEVLPKIAISQAYNLLEREVSEVVLEEGQSRSPRLEDVLSALKEKGLSESWLKQVRELRTIRNRVVNRKRVDMDMPHITSFIELAADGAAAVRALRSNK